MAKANVFKTAKRIRSQHLGKSWAQVVKIASKGGGTTAKPKRKSAKRKATVKRAAPARRKTATKRKSASKKVGMSTVKAVVQEQLKNELWNKEKANTVKATKKAQKKITNYRSLLKRL